MAKSKKLCEIGQEQRSLISAPLCFLIVAAKDPLLEGVYGLDCVTNQFWNSLNIS